MNIPVKLQCKKTVDTDAGGFSQFVQIDKIPHEETYMHVIGNYKKSKQHNDFVSFILKEEYPNYWKKIISIYKENQILSDYIKRQMQMQNTYQEKVIPQLVDPVEDYKHTKYFCQLFDIEINSPVLILNEKLFDIQNFEKKIIEFNSKIFTKNKIKITPFNFYNKQTNAFNQIDYEDYYAFVTPYHEITTTKFNWSESLNATKKEQIEKMNPRKSNTLLYLDMYHFSNSYAWLDDSLLHLLEKIKSKPTTIKNLLFDYAQNDTENNILFILKKWYAYGIIYLSKSDFLIQEPSKVYMDSLFNINSQVLTCLKYILEHYNTNKNIAEITFQFENPKTIISLQEIITTFKNLDFEAQGVRGDISNLRNANLPAIALLKLREHLTLHVIITKVTATHVTIYNTELKELERYNKNYFSTIWNGILILLAPKKNNFD